MVDCYLSDKKFLVVLINNFLNVGVLVGSLVGAQLYVAGTWLAVGLGSAALSLFAFPALIPLYMIDSNPHRQLPLEEESRRSQSRQTPEDASIGDYSRLFSVEAGSLALAGGEEGVFSRLRTPRRILIYLLPDIAYLFVNTVDMMLFVALPYRLVTYNDRPVLDAVFFTQIMNVVAFSVSIICGYIASTKVNPFLVLAAGVVFHYGGAVMMFGSTTDSYMCVHYGLEIGLVFLGLGVGILGTIPVMSKFILFEKWGLSIVGLGQHATAVNLLAVSVSAFFGIILSGTILSESSEIYFLVFNVITLVFSYIAMLACTAP